MWYEVLQLSDSDGHQLRGMAGKTGWQRSLSVYHEQAVPPSTTNIAKISFNASKLLSAFVCLL